MRSFTNGRNQHQGLIEHVAGAHGERLAEELSEHCPEVELKRQAFSFTTIETCLSVQPAIFEVGSQIT